ncbi:MAG: cell division protein ZapA [Rhodoferax sp.]|uniref:cell division protein ZapA n=1 Tax=Rhodoferax sp. TaxID=50421 RepID=UPI00178E3BE0|nr:cell division protein ZapA [Rhodoferax sp.]NMM12731.1 cell division protein ZapA [Rhodoferax sp.]NMM19924.1 cell division protein ZapA [Rhodoferax sp.]
MKQLEVQIMGQSYLLGCPEGGDFRLLEAVERVDTAMCKIRDGGKVRARDRIAVLAALNLAFDLADQGSATPQAQGNPSTENLNSDASHGPQSESRELLLTSLLERLDVALGDDSRLI